MATYAAYRHVELDKVGCGKRSIMKPPGGDSHDIFGADFHGTPSHHRVLKPPGGGTSSLFASTTEEKPLTKTGSTILTPEQSATAIQSSSYHIEGKPNGLNGKPGKENDFKPKGQTSVVKKSQDSTVDLLSVPSSILSAEINNLTAQESKREGNPVTGEGYDNPETHTPVPPRTRIPPGGYSSGLW